MSFVEAIREALPEDGIFCDEMTQVGYVSWFGMPFHAPRTLITSGFSGTLGAGFPTALGVKVACPDRAVVAVTGDGGFLFGGSDLATAVRFGINLVTVVFNNSAYGNVLRDQRRLFDGRHAGAELTNPDFQTYARAFGVRSWRVDDATGLRGAVKEALAANAPCLIEVMTDITQESEPWRFIAPTRRCPASRRRGMAGSWTGPGRRTRIPQGHAPEQGPARTRRWTISTEPPCTSSSSGNRPGAPPRGGSRPSRRRSRPGTPRGSVPCSTRTATGGTSWPSPGT
jgi:hypothetical protein